MPVTLTQIYEVSVGDIEMVSVDYTDHLDGSEVLTGTPTVTEVTTSDLTISNKVVNTSALTVLGRTVAIGKAVQFRIAGHQAGTTYTVRISIGTTSDPARTVVRDVKFKCI